MHVGLDLMFLVPGATGGRETYARELTGALRAARPDLRFTAFVNRETAAAGPGFWSAHADRVVVLPGVSALARARWAAGELAVVPRAAARAGVDVLHSPANFAPLGGPFTRVLTLHDVIFRRLPQTLTPAMRWGTELMVPPAARRAHRIVTGSAAARDDIVAELGVPAERIEVVPHGIVPAAAVDATAAAAARHALAPAGRSLVLSVATDVVHKNLPALLRGLALVDPARRPMLAFAGHGTDAGALPALARELGVAPDVRFLGAVAPGALEELYAAADALVTATRYEGFGLPVLEAMARDVPVACSDLPVLREVAGDAAVWLDPGAPASIAAALGEVLAGGQAIERLRAAGRERAARFTWEAAARATAGAYERALSATTKTRLA